MKCQSAVSVKLPCAGTGVGEGDAPPSVCVRLYGREQRTGAVPRPPGRRPKRGGGLRSTARPSTRELRHLHPVGEDGGGLVARRRWATKMFWSRRSTIARMRGIAGVLHHDPLVARHHAGGGVEPRLDGVVGPELPVARAGTPGGVARPRGEGAPDHVGQRDVAPDRPLRVGWVRLCGGAGRHQGEGTEGGERHRADLRMVTPEGWEGAGRPAVAPAASPDTRVRARRRERSRR